LPMRPMQLLIVRHGIAEPRDRRQWADDRARPLSKTGLARTRSAAAGLRRIIEPPTRVWSSQLLRARQTAVILQKVAGWPHADLCDELGPSKSAAALLARIERLAPRRLALIGHEPQLSQLLALCLAGRTPGIAIQLKKSAVACLEFTDAAQAGGAKLLWLAPPRLLRQIR
jgi:phosphohistidine phosphatase